VGSKGKQHLLLICPKETHRKLVRSYFKSGVLPSSPSKATYDIDKISETPLGRFKEISHFNSKGLNESGQIYLKEGIYHFCLPLLLSLQ